MAMLDTSVLGSYYCPETLSPAVNAALLTISNPHISILGEVEFTSLLSFKVRCGHMAAAEAARIRQLFFQHRAQHLYRIVTVSQREFSLAARWLGRFNTSLRTLDALQLATASSVRQTLWTTDKILATSAKMLGVPCKLISL